MSPKPKEPFPVMLEPEHLTAMKAIEARTGVVVSDQISRAVHAYLHVQTVLSKSELKNILGE
jgi:hypothetical protein